MGLFGYCVRFRGHSRVESSHHVQGDSDNQLLVIGRRLHNQLGDVSRGDPQPGQGGGEMESLSWSGRYHPSLLPFSFLTSAHLTRLQAQSTKPLYHGPTSVSSLHPCLPLCRFLGF